MQQTVSWPLLELAPSSDGNFDVGTLSALASCTEQQDTVGAQAGE
jgi:hypothetical protein